MIVLLALFILLNMAASHVSAGFSADDDQQRRIVEASAANMLIYHAAARSYLTMMPIPGVVADGALTLPSWYGKTGEWLSVFDGSCLSTYAAGGPASARAALLAETLLIFTDGDAGVARVSAGQLVSYRSQTAIAPAGAIPTGTTAYVSCIS